MPRSYQEITKKLANSQALQAEAVEQTTARPSTKQTKKNCRGFSNDRQQVNPKQLQGERSNNTRMHHQAAFLEKARQRTHERKKGGNATHENGLDIQRNPSTGPEGRGCDNQLESRERGSNEKNCYCKLFGGRWWPMRPKHTAHGTRHIYAKRASCSCRARFYMYICLTAAAKARSASRTYPKPFPTSVALSRTSLTPSTALPPPSSLDENRARTCVHLVSLCVESHS